MLNETFALDSEDEKIWTGTETSPKEIVAVAILRAGMDVIALVTSEDGR
jgi:hypothetical protein